MMSELSFLIELLLNHRLPKQTKDAVAARIKEIESQQPPVGRQAAQPMSQPLVTKSRYPIEGAAGMPASIVDPQPVVQIAQNAETQAALNYRADLMNKAAAGKHFDKATGKTRKW